MRRIQGELDAARARYFDLYDLAPVGYVTLNEKGLILEANLTAATLLGVARGALIMQPFSRFVLRDDQEVYYLHRTKLIETNAPQTCDLRMVRRNAPVFWARLTATVAQDTGAQDTGAQESDGAPVFRVVLSDITARKFEEDERVLTAHLIVLINTSGDLHERLEALTGALQAWSGCEAVGIRLQVAEDYPYYVTRGFLPTFVQAESHLCAHGPDGQILRDGAGNPVLECMCGNILSGRFDPAQPYFTAHGSFWTNSTTKADRQAYTRNHCNRAGYESVALIPLHIGPQVIGLLQFNDRRPNHFSPILIAQFERMADSLAVSLARHQAGEALEASAASLRAIFDNSVQSFMLLDRERRVQALNQVADEWARTIYGGELQPGHAIAEYLQPEARASFDRDFDRVLAGATLYMERSFSADGGDRWLEFHIAPVYGSGAYVTGVFLSTTDVTERKQAEEQLKQQMHELERWYHVTLNRETRNLELKHEVNELLAQAGQPPRYPSAER